MSTSFVTEFPVNKTCDISDFIREIKKWILGSPHTNFVDADFIDLNLKTDNFNREKLNEKIIYIRGEQENSDSASLNYIKKEANNFEWLSNITYYKDNHEAWISCRISCESLRPSKKVPEAKKPYFIKTFLENLGGGCDANLFVSNNPIFLNNDDVFFVSEYINGSRQFRLPIVYVSSDFYMSESCIDVNKVARKLSGMAHVLVEPDRSFSISLRKETNGQNVYGGTIGIYWPDGGGRRSFFIGQEFKTKNELENSIYEEIRVSLINRRPLTKCTWSAVQESLSKKQLSRLKEQGSTDIKTYIEVFDNEIAAKEHELKDAENEINRLKSELKKYESSKFNELNIGLICKEQNLYENEIKAIVLNELKASQTKYSDIDCRRRDVINNIIELNDSSFELQNYREKLKQLLRGYRSLDSKLKRELESLGFNISDNGKHHKLVFRGDERYVFAMPKSGSDNRGGLNLAGDISRILF